MAELRERGYPEDVIEAVAGHADYLEVPRETRLAKTLYAVDELSGFVMACALVRPTGIEGIKVKSVRKKLKQPSFAAKVDREQIRRGIAELGVEEGEHIAVVIEALAVAGRSARADRGPGRGRLSDAPGPQDRLRRARDPDRARRRQRARARQPDEARRGDGRGRQDRVGVIGRPPGVRLAGDRRRPGGRPDRSPALLRMLLAVVEPDPSRPQRATPGVRIDLIGHGGSAKPQSGYEIDTQAAAAVAEALNSLGVQGATVVGHSLGGSVATSLAEQASELVDRIVLIGRPVGVGRGLAAVHREARSGSRCRTGSLAAPPRRDDQAGYGSAFAPGTDVSTVFPDDPDRVVDDNRAMTYDSFTEASAKAGDFLDEQPIASRLAATGVPVMWIDGSEDQILDAAAVAEEFHAVPGAITKLIDGVGHSPNVEAPAATAKLILDFAGVAPPVESAGGQGRRGPGRQERRLGSAQGWRLSRSGSSSSRVTRPARSCSRRRSPSSIPMRSASTVELERFDLSLENRRRTANGVCTEAAVAMRAAGLGLKAATITPEGADDVGSPNRLIREGIDGTVIVRTGRRIPGVTPIAGIHHPITVCRMAVGDAYGAEQWRERSGDDEIAFRTERISRRVCRAVAEHAFRIAAAAEDPRARVYGGPKWTVSPVYEGMLKEEMDAAAGRHPDVPYEPVLIDATYAGLVGGAADRPAGDPDPEPRRRPAERPRDADVRLDRGRRVDPAQPRRRPPPRRRDGRGAPRHRPGARRQGRRQPDGDDPRLRRRPPLRRRARAPEAERASAAIYEATLGAAGDGIRTHDLGGEASTSEVCAEVVTAPSRPLAPRASFRGLRTQHTFA